MGSVQLRRAVHDMKDTDNFCEGLCWVLHHYVVDGCLADRCCVGPGLEHKLGKGLAEVGPDGDGSFESCGVVRRVVESVTLLAVNMSLSCAVPASRCSRSTSVHRVCVHRLGEVGSTRGVAGWDVIVLVVFVVN